jgi:hypothetical protein
MQVSPSPSSFTIIHDLHASDPINANSRNPSNKSNGIAKQKSHMRCHNVHFVECLGTIGALSHAILDAIFHAVVAEEVTTSLQDCVLKVLSTDGTKRKSLGNLV